MRELAYAEAIAEALREEMERDERVVRMRHHAWDPLGGASGAAGGAGGPESDERHIDLPAAELAWGGAAVGAALAGLRPVVEWPDAAFAILAMDAVIHHAAPLRFRTAGSVSVPIVFRAPIGGDGAVSVQYSPCLESWFCAVPGLKVVLPSTPRDARGLLKSAIRDPDPVLFLEHRSLYETRGEVPEEEETIPIGEAATVRYGSDLSIVAYAGMVAKALEAAALLAEEGIEAEVLDLRSVLPLDEAAILASVARTGRLLIAQEAYGPCSVAAEVAALVAEKGLYHLDAPIRRVTARWAPIPFAAELQRAVLPQTETIATAVRELLAAEE